MMTTKEMEQAWVRYRLNYEDFGSQYYGRGTFVRDEFRDWLREQLAEAWDEGFMECADWWEIHHAQVYADDNNPHRTEPHE